MGKFFSAEYREERNCPYCEEGVATLSLEEQKFDYIFSLVQLMKIDQRLYRNEIKYCAKVASTLGYREEVLFELMLKVKSFEMEKNEMDALRKLTATYLQKK